MKRILTPAERLIVAADFKPNRPKSGSTSTVWDVMRTDVQHRISRLIHDLSGTGVYIKVDSALRAVGSDLTEEIRKEGLNVFADLNLIGDGDAQTLETDGRLLSETGVGIVTASCFSGAKGLMALKAELPRVLVLGTMVPKGLSVAEIGALLACGNTQTTHELATIAMTARLDGVVLAPSLIKPLRPYIHEGALIVSTGICPAWAKSHGDDNGSTESMPTPAEAIKAGADCIIVGPQITEAADPRNAVRRTLNEVSTALRKRKE